MYQEEYKKINDRLVAISDVAISEFEEADKKKSVAMLNYVGDMLTEQLKIIQDVLEKRVDELEQRAEKELNNVVEVIEIKLEQDFFNDITPSQYAEIELIKELDMQIEDVQRYVEKFN